MSISFPLLLVASWFAASVVRSPHVGFCIARQQQLRFPRVFSDTASAGNLRVVNPACGFKMFQETRKHDVFFLKCIDLYWLMMCRVVFLQFSWVRVLHVLRPIVQGNTNIVKTWSPTKSCWDTCCSGYVRTTDYVNSQLPLDFYRLKQLETSKQHHKINKLWCSLFCVNIADGRHPKRHGILWSQWCYWCCTIAECLDQIAWAWCSRCWRVFCWVKFWFWEYYGNSDLLWKEIQKLDFITLCYWYILICSPCVCWSQFLVMVVTSSIGLNSKDVAKVLF